MIPMTRKEFKPEETVASQTLMCGINLWKIAKVITLYEVISTLLMPFKVHVITGQYGALRYSHKDMFGDHIYWTEFLSLTDISVTLEVFLISLLSFVHLWGYISIRKNWIGYFVLYIFFRLCQLYFIIFIWTANLHHEFIRSHTISKPSLMWYAVSSIVSEMISEFILFRAFCEAKNKNE